jgi:hypothetical protein
MEKQIKDFPDYFIHSDGYVISRKFGKERHMAGNMRGGKTKGYDTVTLMQNNVQFGRMVHRLVAEHFLDQVVGKNEVNHKDGNKLNNNVDNLEWTSRKENMRHSVKTGLWTSPTKEHYKMMCGRAGQSKALFTMEEASDLMEMMAALKLSSRKMAAIVGCSKPTILRLQHNTTIHFTNGSVV